MDRQFKVVGKMLKGSDEQPALALSSNEGDRLTWNLETEDQLGDYEIGQILTVKVVKEQQKLE